ncbi:MAG: FHA domain-containing protein [Anaerolineae bacterium]
MRDKSQNRDELPVLLVTEGPGSGQQRVLRNEELVIGRGEHNDFVIRDRRISREHTRVFRADDGIYVEDLKSTNGTYLNGEKLEEPHRLREGDEIQLAACVRIQFIGNEATVPVDIDDAPGAEPSEYGLQLDNRTREVQIDGVVLDPQLSLLQYRLLELLYTKDGDVCTREEVVRAVWPNEDEQGVSEQAIDALVRRLRDRLAALSDHQYIVTVRGHGFRLVQPE